MGPYGAHMGPPGQVLAGPISDFWSNFACFGTKTKFLTKFLDDSAWFLLEKLKKHVILTKNLNISSKIPKRLKKSQTLRKIPRFPRCLDCEI